MSSVADFGAVGDGQTDDTAALQKAENSTNGGTLFWPPGTYMVNSTGLTKRAVTWIANGPVTIMAAASTWTVPLVSGSGLFGFGVIGIGFDTSLMQGATPATPALALTCCSDWRVRSCSFTGIQVFGVSVDGGSDFTIQDSEFTKPTPVPTQNEAINVSCAAGPVVNAEIIDNTMIGCGMDICAAYSMIARNSVSDWQFGAGITTEQSPDCYGLTIAENMLVGGTGTDANSTVVPGIENWAPRSNIIGNICANNAGDGIDNGGAASTVAGNICFNNGRVNNGAGICTRYASAAYNGSYSFVSGNNCFDTQTPHTQGYGYADQSPSVTDVTVAGNKLHDCLHGPMDAIGQRTDFRGPQLFGTLGYSATSLPNGTSAGGSFVVPGAAMGDLVRVSCSIDTGGCKLFGWVSAPNTVSFRLENNVGEIISLGAAAINVIVEKPLNYGAY